MINQMTNNLPHTRQLKKLSEVWEIVTWITPSKNKPEYWWGDFPFVKPPNLGSDELIVETEENLTKLGKEHAKIIPKWSIMVCCIWSLGKIGIAWRELSTNQQINSITFDEGKVDRKYGYYFCTTLKEKMELMANKAIVAIINKSIFSTIQIPLPPLPTQHAIVTYLDQATSEIDSAIQEIHDQLSKLDALWASTLQEAMSGEWWEKRKVWDITSKIQYGYTGKVVDKSNFRYLRITDIQNGKVDRETVPFCDIDDFEANKYQLVPWDIVFARTGATVWKSYLVDENWIGQVFASYLIRISTLQDLIKPNFLMYFFQSNEYREQIYKDVAGAAQPNFNGKKLGEVKVPLPPLSTQQSIVSHLDAVSAEISQLRESYTQQLRHLQELKASVMDEVFSGKWKGAWE